MKRQWTFGQKVAGGIGLLVILTAVIAATAYGALRTVVAAKDRVIDVNAALLIDAHRANGLAEAKSSDTRAFLLTRDERLLVDAQNSRAQLLQTINRLRQNTQTPEGRGLAEAVGAAEEAQQRALDAVIAQRRTTAPIDVVARAFDEQVLPARDRLDAAINAFVAREETNLATSRQAASDLAARAINITATLLAIAAICGTILGVLLTRTLSRQIGTAVGQVQSSSTELQAAATQQATGAKQQATAMTEIATTISELLATSRQITDSARRVAQIAEETAAAARDGGHIVDRGTEATAAIRRQVDLVVSHMVELGNKSQQIGGVLNVVSELAEQTNILAINASIEAVGAGENGRRFGVVADEIRKLADRVGGSTKEIKALIDDVRSAVNTTVMATEAGSKAVDTGAAQFGQVTTSFKQIVGLVTTTTEAAREIELSIKQQMSAIEQVNVAITNIAQATRETEASTGQTQQTASQLAVLSKDLLRVIRPEQAV
jgi:methyl-accepting chemotaxis protein